MRKRIIIVGSVLVLSGVLWYASKPKISIEVADWLNKKVEYKVSAGFKSVSGVKFLSDKQTTVVTLGLNQTTSISSEGNKIIISYKNMSGDLVGVTVDFTTQTISPTQKLIGS